LGLALTVAEAFPGFVRKGRARVEPQLGIARAVGGMAAQQGYRQFVRLAGGLAGRGMGLLHRPVTATRAAASPPRAGTVDASGTGRVSSGPSRVTPSVEGLAIPSYDSLSAVQVVQRLGGLSREEVAAIRDYELATRARRSIVSKTEQLLG